MAVKPIISMITPWDSTVGTNIVFSYSGNLPVFAKAVVRNASTLTIIWTSTKTVVSDTEGRYLFNIEANAFKANPADADGNGNKYCIQITTVDNNNESSAVSDKTYFWCFATPEFYFYKPEAEAMIENTYIQADLIYTQSNGEKIYSYRYYLYDNSKCLIAMSDQFYTDDDFEYFFKGVENKTSYYVRAQGITKNGIPLDTGYVHVFTNYDQVENYSILSLESDDNATVTGLTNMICIDADEDSNDYIFINSLVQLIGKKVTYQTNYKIARDFTMQIKITKVLYNGVLIIMFNKNNPDCIVTLDSYVFDDGLLRYCLKASNGIATYVLYTEGMEAENDDYIVITIRRINNLFSLDATKVID